MFVLAVIILIVVLFELTKALIKDTFETGIKKRQKEFANMAIRESYFQQISDIKKGEIVPEDNKNVIYVDMKDFMNFVDMNFDAIMKSVEENERKAKVQKIEKRTKIMLFGSFALTTIVTIMTFIWGLL